MKVAIIGGGASGLVCAVSLKREDRKNEIEVTVFEGRDRVGKKLLATGNGRCNLMNRNFSPSFYSSPEFVAPATEKFCVESNLDFFRKSGLYTREDSEGRIYPMSNQASGVLDALRFECDSLGVKLLCESPVKKIEKKRDKYYIGDSCFDCVVLCCGSGASVKGFTSYELLKCLDHSIVSPVPSLTKICVKENGFTKRLKGIRCRVKLTLKEKGRYIAEEEGELLFADYGLSGIAVMQLSAYIARNRKSPPSAYSVKADFVPDMSFEEMFGAIRLFIKNRPEVKADEILGGFMPKKLGESIIKESGIPYDFLCKRLSDEKLKNIVSACKGFTFTVTALKGFEDAQVVSGGGNLEEFDKNTMESKNHRGLYCCGEFLDIDGLCGGYNLMWAISSARLCAENIRATYKRGL